VLERRPPAELTQVAETLLGEPWQGEGLAGAGYMVDAEMLWRRVLARLDAGVRLLRRGARLKTTEAVVPEADGDDPADERSEA
jgi:hypothetical protein